MVDREHDLDTFLSTCPDSELIDWGFSVRNIGEARIALHEDFVRINQNRALHAVPDEEALWKLLESSVEMQQKTIEKWLFVFEVLGLEKEIRNLKGYDAYLHVEMYGLPSPYDTPALWNEFPAKFTTVVEGCPWYKASPKTLLASQIFQSMNTVDDVGNWDPINLNGQRRGHDKLSYDACMVNSGRARSISWSWEKTAKHEKIHGLVDGFICSQVVPEMDLDNSTGIIPEGIANSLDGSMPMRPEVDTEVIKENFKDIVSTGDYQKPDKHTIDYLRAPELFTLVAGCFGVEYDIAREQGYRLSDYVGFLIEEAQRYSRDTTTGSVVGKQAGYVIHLLARKGI